jgi:mannose-6-phosphate isomerase-like protein (cupin superfamily)
MSAATPTEAAAVDYGVALTFETVGPGEASLRVRPGGDTLMRVIAGTVRLISDDLERLLFPGDEAIVPAGTPHRVSGAGAQARLLSGVRPAGRK